MECREALEPEKDVPGGRGGGVRVKICKDGRCDAAVTERLPLCCVGPSWCQNLCRCPSAELQAAFYNSPFNVRVENFTLSSFVSESNLSTDWHFSSKDAARKVATSSPIRTLFSFISDRINSNNDVLGKKKRKCS